MSRQGKNGISWTDETWNPIRGCSRVSEGCRNCYAERVAHRFSGEGQPYEGLTTSKGRWNGTIRWVDHKLDEPLRWQRPRMVFVNSMSDLFHPGVSFQQIATVFGIMAAAERHTFQVLTKRPERMVEFFEWLKPTSPDFWHEHWTCFALAATELGSKRVEHRPVWPLPNVWLGVSVENQTAADTRIPLLLQAPAQVRWISAEPLLGPLDLSGHLGGLDWVVVGGESGTGARPMHPDWARSIRNQCVEAGVAFHFKQWGAFNEHGQRVGKKASDRILDGRTWDEYPEGGVQ